MPLSQFHPLVQEWFKSRFSEPTDAQLYGWPAIAEGRHTLIAAPTGSGKTLAAFLTCIDSLVRQGLSGEIPDRTQVVYVSPLKALSNDIQKNLATPLEEIAALADAAGTPLPEIRAAVRTGDTRASERTKMAKKPPHILITTPESLYILLTSRSGRQGLAGVHTLILDEIHAVADDKRGSHLSLSVERLCALAENPIVRIGLSATQRPIEEIARLLVGSESIAPDGKPDCLIVDTGRARTIDLAIQLPQRELGPIASHEMWGEALDSVTELVRAHGTTLVFVNTRRLVERVSHQLSERLGDEAVVAHHGSLSRTTRLAAEQKLKSGQVKVCVATASLELGIDIGVVDLVCQIGSPRSIGVLLQRVGRSGHQVGGTPKGRLYPLTRDELAECVALARAVKRHNLDTLTIPPWPLDVLAQQIVASCAQEEWTEEELFALCRRAYPYRELPREKFDQVIEVLSEGFTLRQGRRGAYLHRDGINMKVKGRRGAPIAAMTSGGAIPDNADYDVILDPEET
ncbi:MAG: DEAD/DEAH box helicase, partial [Chloroflexi bacterium]|nr:DEAD/DEAH box helicase [Chloroflexota bacterium]